MPNPSALAGVLVIDKPRGPTSMDVVEFVRRRAGHAKTGHAGTLDPLATGVLVVAIGSATKSIDLLMKTDKHYETTIDLRAFSSTDDAQGERSAVAVESPPTEQRIREAVRDFVGSIMQRPPAFSAIKIGGQRAYKKARQGEIVEIAARPVLVHAIEVKRYEWPEVQLCIHCDKGFYVRSLARDLGQALGTGGFCQSIRRTAVGPFTLELAKSLETLPDKISQADLIRTSDAIAMVQTPVSPANS